MSRTRSRVASLGFKFFGGLKVVSREGAGIGRLVSGEGVLWARKFGDTFLDCIVRNEVYVAY